MNRRNASNTWTRADLLDEAGPVYFARGEEYFDGGTVQAVCEKNGVVSATVRGTQLYETLLAFRDGEVDGQCSCPLGEDGQFCKHLVATGLAWIEQQQQGRRSKGKAKPITPQEIEAFLGKLKKPELVRILMAQAEIDDELYAMLKLRIAADRASSSTAEMRGVLRQAMTIHDFVSWRDTGSYTRGVDRVIEQLRTLLTPKHAAQVIELAEYGMDLWEENIERIDDSNGCMGMIQDDLHQLHFEACAVAKPDPVALAERLARRAIDSNWEMFHGSYEAYRDLFGETGRTRYREIVEAEWNALPKLAPGKEDPEPYGRTGTLERLMLSIAEGEKDLELIICVLSRDLSCSYTYLRIAERCRDARQYKRALEWAEKGVKAFANDPDSRLRSFLADEYLRAKRPDDTMAMVWANFDERPELGTYQDLARYAKKLKCWEKWREKAFARMRATVKKEKADFERKVASRLPRGGRAFFRWAPPPPDHSLLVAVLLWEKDEVGAWAEAQKGNCSDRLWLDLAKRREQNHPADAIEIYRRQVVPLIEQTNNDAYEQAVKLMGRVHGLMKEISQEMEFRAWLLELKSEYKRKRNFIKYVERKAWGIS